MTSKATVSLEELREKVIQVATKCCDDGIRLAEYGFYEALDAYREATVMAERERCEKLCESRVWNGSTDHEYGFELGKTACARAIGGPSNPYRSRSE